MQSDASASVLPSVFAGIASENSPGCDTTPPAETRPFWIPPNVRFDALAPQVQRAITEVVNAAYQELVLDAPSALARAVGLTLVHTLWLELLQQIELNEDVAESLHVAAHEDSVRRLLRFANAKEKAARLLLDLRKFEARMGREPLETLIQNGG